MEIIKSKDKDDIKYEIFTPNDSDVNTVNNQIVNIVEPRSIAEYKRIVKPQISKMREKTNVIASNTIFIAIISMQMNCYVLNAYGSKNGISPRATALIQKDYAFMYSGSQKSYYKICWFAVPVYYNHYIVNKKTEAFHSKHEVPT
ncbi:MAG: hypothetical protein LBB45_00405 [Methanobrevibacter sp.]|nr:hypothetical protein [Candidatus Methanovirga basalitermitum]